MSLRVVATILFAVTTGAGCDSGPDEAAVRSECRRALQHVIDLQTAPLPDADESSRAELARHRDNLSESIDATALDACADGSDEWRECLLAATDLDGIHACSTGGAR